MSESEEKGFISRLWSGNQEPGDVLERPRRNEESPMPAAKSATPSDRAYLAFKTRDRATDRLHIHCATGPSHFPSSNYLLDIIFDHDFQSMFTLVYSFMIVEITGRNLAPVVHAISYGNCESIHEFHENMYDAPLSNVPIIEGITMSVAFDDKKNKENLGTKR